MTKEKLYEVLGDINEGYVKESKEYRRANKSALLRWGAVAACLCLIIVGALVWRDDSSPSGSGGTLMGADEIYPTVMVDGKLYEWRRGAAICDSLPDGSVYYGEVTHSAVQTPSENCEFVSVFPVSGQIYTVPDDGECVYLLLTSVWMSETVVVFDLVSPDADGT